MDLDPDDERVMHGAFEQLRPICVELSHQHTRENVQKLRQALKSIDDRAIQILQEYLMFPLRLIIKQSTNKYVEVKL